MADWHPLATFARPHRARLNALLRGFMAERGVLEVETPVLSRGAPLDPCVESWRAFAPGGVSGYLQTSPEYPMKRLLAAGERDIYQLARVFRGEERGARHNPEFSLLEWYRLGFDDRRMADELVELLQSLAAADPRWSRPQPEVRRIRYAELFADAFGLDPLACTEEECAAVAADAGLSIAGDLDRDGWLDALVSLVLTPRFEPDRLTLIHDYPESQAVLARPSMEHQGYAARFELYWGDVELANGFHELTDPQIFVSRRNRDIERRRRNGQTVPIADSFFAPAMHAGLPDCAGVALGVDRLLMRLLGIARIDEVIDFPWGCA